MMDPEWSITQPGAGVTSRTIYKPHCEGTNPTKSLLQKSALIDFYEHKLGGRE